MVMTKKPVDNNAHIRENSVKRNITEGKEPDVATEMKGNTITFSIDICIEKDGESYYAYCPALKGIHVDGDTEQEALENAKAAAMLYIESLIKHGDTIPLKTVDDPSHKSAKSVCSPSQKWTEDVRVAI
jgi:predicted RNase H-like HicB family nuclease